MMKRAPLRGERIQVFRVIRRLTLVGVGVAIGMLVLGVLVLFDARQDAWRQAEQASANLVLALEQDIARNITIFDLSLQGVAEALQEPGIGDVSPKIRQMALFDRAATAEHLGAVLVLDSTGNIVEDSTSLAPHQVNLADRDYFRIHREQADAGIYLSNPYSSRLQPGDIRIAISRRLSGPDGHFTGVVMGALRLTYFRDEFRKLDLGFNGVTTLFKTNGRLVARYPFVATETDLDLSRGDNFRHVDAQTLGSFTATSMIDGILRLYSFHRVGNLPLILTVGVSVEEIYAIWWRKALIIGTILVALCSGVVTLCLLFRHEMLRRMAAEHSLVEAAGRLSVAAATDGLTGLANRRAFDVALNREWKRAIHGQRSIALLMLDADCFKLYNDHYGHPAGDNVLKQIAACILQSTRRSSDLSARYGGEEFVILLPESDLAGGRGIAEAIRRTIEALGIPHSGNPNGQVTVSIGVAVAHPTNGEDCSLLLKAADDALYDAKHSGRNRVSSAGLDGPPVEALTQVLA